MTGGGVEAMNHFYKARRGPYISPLYGGVRRHAERGMIQKNNDESSSNQFHYLLDHSGKSKREP